MKQTQTSFIDGLNLISSDVDISASGYRYLFNGRQRFGKIKPIKKHKKDLITENGVTPGRIQGGIAVGDILFLFVGGRAYYRQEGSQGWSRVPGFQMSSTASRLWAETVPQSTFNFARKSVTGNDGNSRIIVTLDTKVAGTPSCIVVQDGGESQPYLIFSETAPDGTISLHSREAKRYGDWQNTTDGSLGREYVPRGREMLYQDNILYIVAPDRKSVYRSVTGRPLDFVIAVDSRGNKLGSEKEGGAERLSFSFDYDEITCIKSVNVPYSFVYGTTKQTRIVTLDTVNTIFGEPRFNISATISAGIVNQESWTEILGDYAFVDYKSVKTFNAVKQLKWEGKNSIFSKMLSSILEGYRQSEACVTSYDDYALFNLKTSFGDVIAVYDTLLDKWVSIDITEVFNVLQFIKIETDDVEKLYAITRDNNLYEMFAETETYPAFIRTKSFSPEVSKDHKGSYLKAVFSNPTYTGYVTLIEHVDEKESLDVRQINSIIASPSGIYYPVIPPVIVNTEATVETITFSTSEGARGKKIHYLLLWDNDAELEGLEILTSEDSGVTPSQQQKIYGS